jgi:hypothetical protein
LDAISFWLSSTGQGKRTIAFAFACDWELKRIMDFIEAIDKSAITDLKPIAESDLFAIYAVGEQTYLLVQRHQGTPWMALRLSGDGLFRVASLLGDATRHLYREVASRLSPNRAADPN